MNRMLLIIAAFCGLMFASAVTAVAPGSALWMSHFVCHGGAHLSHLASDTSYGTTSQQTIAFSCVNAAGHATAVSTWAVFLLQFVFGTLVTFGALFGLGGLRRPLRTAPSS